MPTTPPYAPPLSLGKKPVQTGYVGPVYEDDNIDTQVRYAITVPHSYLAGSVTKQRPVTFYLDDILVVNWDLPNEAPMGAQSGLSAIKSDDWKAGLAVARHGIDYGTRDVVVLKSATERTITLAGRDERNFLRGMFGVPPIP